MPPMYMYIYAHVEESARVRPVCVCVTRVSRRASKRVIDRAREGHRDILVVAQRPGHKLRLTQRQNHARCNAG